MPPLFPPTALQFVISPVKIRSTSLSDNFDSGLDSFTITATASLAITVLTRRTPFAPAVAFSLPLSSRLDIPIWAVPSIMAAIPVEDPSAAISNFEPGFLFSYASAILGIIFAPNVSEPLMINLSCALERTENIRKRLVESVLCNVFIRFF